MVRKIINMINKREITPPEEVPWVMSEGSFLNRSNDLKMPPIDDWLLIDIYLFIKILNSFRFEFTYYFQNENLKSS